MARQYFLRSVDFAARDCVVPAELNTGFDTLNVYSDTGLIIQSRLAPDVIENPELKRFFWVEVDDSDVPTGDVYYYNGAEWTLWNLLDGSRLFDNSVPIEKFSTSGANPLDIIQVNAAGTSFTFVNLVAAIPLNSLSLSKITAEAALNGYIPRVVGGVLQYVNLNSGLIVGIIAANSIDVTQLKAGTVAGQVPVVKTDLSGVEWQSVSAALAPNSVELSKLARGTGNARKVPRQNADGTVTDWEEIPSYAPSISRRQALAAVPANGLYVDFNFNDARYPDSVEIFLQCKTANNSFNVGERIPIESITRSDSDNESPVFNFLTTVNNVRVARCFEQMGVLNPNTGSAVSIEGSVASWELAVVINFNPA